VSPLDFATYGATYGKVIKFDGTQWRPMSDSLGTGGAASIDTFSYNLDTLKVSVAGDGVAAHNVYIPTRSRIISPSQLTSDQDNYNPTGFDTATVIRVSSDNGFRAITSLAAQSDGEEKKFINVGTYPLYFPGEHPDGTAANRIAYGEDIILQPFQSITFYYDNTSSRWRPLNYTFASSYRTSDVIVLAGSVAAGDHHNLGLTTSGGAGTGHANADPGVTNTFVAGRMATGTTATGATMSFLNKNSPTSYKTGTFHISNETIIQIEDLSTGADSFTVFFTQTTNANTSVTWSGNNNIGFKYSHGVYAGNWTAYTIDNAGTKVEVDLGVAVAADQPYQLRFEFDKSYTEARFYIDNIYRGRIASGLPSSANYGLKTDKHIIIPLYAMEFLI